MESEYEAWAKLRSAGFSSECRDAGVYSTAQSKTYIRVPRRRILRPTDRLARALVGSVLAPIYWLIAYRHQVPGLQFRIKFAFLGLRLLCQGRSRIPLREIYRVLIYPLDSVRYFEFDFVWKALSEFSFQHYLDVSSPRLLPILLVQKRSGLFAQLVNPDLKDLTATANLMRALRLESRCDFHSCLISSVPFRPSSFDIVTSISVLEHIPDDKEAIRIIWRLLKPGGRLLLTVPCALKAREEYIDRNEYGLLGPTEGGFFFHQRFYDQRLLTENIFSIVGRPSRFAVYGEKVCGTYHANERAKMSDPSYPSWREPYTVGESYQYFNSVDDLPGIGVIAMEFVKT
jgi:SAM-dependent methyltransferase